VRLLKTLKFLKNTNNNRDSKADKLTDSVKQISKIIFSIMYVSNLVGCFWFFQSSFSDFPEDSWVRSADIIEETPLRQFLISYYWAF